MAKKLIYILLFFSLPVFGQTTYYIDPAGSDDTGNGTSGNPWASLYKASNSVTTSGDTIYVNPGEYTETRRCLIRIGVHIKGSGETSHVKLTYARTVAHDASIYLYSENPGENGNQTISYLKLDGDDLTGSTAISVYKRSNVTIHNCTIVDFLNSAIRLTSTSTSVIAENNKIHDCIITNCSQRDNPLAAEDGNIFLRKQKGLRIYNNVIDQTARSQGNNGNIVTAITGTYGSQNEDFHYYNNKSYKPIDEGTDGEWNFHIEHWDGRGGIEVYNNEFHGGGCGIDIGGYLNTVGSYGYSWKVYNNLFYQDEQETYVTGRVYNMGVQIETKTDDAYIYNNYFVNKPWPVYFTLAGTVDSARYLNNIHVYYNIMDSCGYANTTWCAGILVSFQRAWNSIDSVFIHNNTIRSGPGQPTAGIFVNTEGDGSITNLFIENNIIDNFYHAPIRNTTTAGAIVDNVFARNNIFYSNGNGDSLWVQTGTVTNYEADSIVKTDPLLNTNYTLQSASPAIDYGRLLDYTEDYLGQTVPNGAAPDMGAIEYYADPTPGFGIVPVFYNGKYVFYNGKYVFY